MSLFPKAIIPQTLNDRLDAIESETQTADEQFCLLSATTDQTFTGAKRIINSGGFVGELTEFDGGVGHTAITTKAGIAFLTDSGAGTYTLAAPTTGADDGKVLVIMDVAGHGHTVTQASNGFNAGAALSDVATFGGAIGDSITVVAYKGIWYVVNLTGVTLG